MALSVKLQAVFLAPAFALLLLKGCQPWKEILSSIVGYGALLLPAALVGRPVGELLRVYLQQYDTFQSLALSAPNLWSVVNKLPLSAAVFSVLLSIGLLAAVAFGFAYLLAGRTRIRNTQGNVTFFELAFVSAFVLPFLLPKMHDRYFFCADVLSCILALVDRRWYRLAVLLQIGSITSYAPFLLNVRVPLALGVIANTLVFLAVMLGWSKHLGRYTARDARQDKPDCSIPQ